ncbi:unnamed protein product [Moneuplotes crassus]|uniref:Uncharacterized protein n=1 Tax=Euplotes crassus TaxID=5936 RepID=A0AAD1X3F6_EUPCR|nr:unnamed protein product [Moneuplotes crassus]
MEITQCTELKSKYCTQIRHIPRNSKNGSKCRKIRRKKISCKPMLVASQIPHSSCGRNYRRPISTSQNYRNNLNSSISRDTGGGKRTPWKQRDDLKSQLKMRIKTIEHYSNIECFKKNPLKSPKRSIPFAERSNTLDSSQQKTLKEMFFQKINFNRKLSKQHKKMFLTQSNKPKRMFSPNRTNVNKVTLKPSTNKRSISVNRNAPIMRRKTLKARKRVGRSVAKKNNQTNQTYCVGYSGGTQWKNVWMTKPKILFTNMLVINDMKKNSSKPTQTKKGSRNKKHHFHRNQLKTTSTTANENPSLLKKPVALDSLKNSGGVEINSKPEFQKNSQTPEMQAPAPKSHNSVAPVAVTSKIRYKLLLDDTEDQPNKSREKKNMRDLCNTLKQQAEESDTSDCENPSEIVPSHKEENKDSLQADDKDSCYRSTENGLLTEPSCSQNCDDEHKNIDDIITKDFELYMNTTKNINDLNLVGEETPRDLFKNLHKNKHLDEIKF